MTSKLKKPPTTLTRYTDLLSVMDTLIHRRLVLLDPSTWDDKNDSILLQRYKKVKQLKTLAALCMSNTLNTYHHWKVFSGHVAGASIIFKRSHFLESISKIEGLRTGTVRYMTLERLKRDAPIDIEKLPFVKRQAYRHEDEFRLIYEDKKKKDITHEITIQLESIRTIVIVTVPEDLIPTEVLEAQAILAAFKVRNITLWQDNAFNASELKLDGVGTIKPANAVAAADAVFMRLARWGSFKGTSIVRPGGAR